MRDLKQHDNSGCLFKRWNLEDNEWLKSRAAQQKLASLINTLKKTTYFAQRNMIDVTM